MDGELARTTFHPLRLHRIYRLRLERDGDRVRLITRGGYNFVDRYSGVIEAALISGVILKAEERELEECSLSSNHYQFSLALGSSVQFAQPVQS
jgi:hypothetical protein